MPSPRWPLQSREDSPMRDSIRRWSAPLLGAALLGGCTMIPDYTRPDAPVASEYPVESASTETTAANLGWRDVFGDERLLALIEIALENNRDLRVAALNVEQVEAFYRIERSQLFPMVGATGSVTVQELPAAIPSSAFIPRATYNANVGITSWELDLFGRVRSLSEQALQQYFATAEARRGAHIALVAQVAVAHFDERAAAEQLELARETLRTVEESHALTARAFELGTASELDLRTAEGQVETARFNLSRYEQRHAEAMNALVFLIGMPLPPDLPDPLPLDETVVIAEIPAGMPSDLLLRRPDILAAEHQLLSANASIGAARAAFFPSIGLTGAAGFSSTDLGQLFSGDSFTWNFTPRIHLPIFQGGRLRASLDAAEIGKEIEIANYERTIQSAFRDVADALVARQAIADQFQAQQARVEAESRRYDLAEMRYRAGIDSYVTLLTAQRDLYTAQQTLIDVQFAQLANVATLYRALGGGWEETSEATASSGTGQEEGDPT